MSQQITAIMLDQWSNAAASRNLLPVLIRRLIRECLPPQYITEMNFPGYENTSRPGVDGILITTTSTEYIPEGKSFWECGTSKNCREKANGDFDKRPPDADVSFVFVTSRNWTGKDNWIATKQEASWRKVTALDANDLEQWLEYAPCTSLWLAEQMGYPQTYLKTPKIFLENWINETEPKFSSEILLNGREIQKNRLIAFLKKMNAESSFIVIADTRDEAAAFIGAAMQQTEFEYHPSSIMLKKEGAEEIEKWQTGSDIPSILIAHSNDVARVVSSRLMEKNMLIIAATREDFPGRRSTIGIKDQSREVITLPRVRDFGLIWNEHREARSYYRKTGGSLSALHRSINKNPGKNNPPWANVVNAERNFIWLALIGRWDEQYSDDKAWIAKLSSIEDYLVWREFVKTLIDVENSPLEQTSEDDRVYRLFSRMDAFNIIARKIDGSDIDRYLTWAERVLIEEDPNYRTPDDNNHSFPKRRKYSDALRSGIVEGLIILNLGKEKDTLTCSNISDKIKWFYDKIFEPERSWYSLSNILPQLAEASPNDFLRKLDQSLDEYPERIQDLFTPRKGPLHYGCNHPKLLWALELLAWSPDRLDRVLKMLCRLQQSFESLIRSNYGNRPSSSLHSILCSRMPQTMAEVEQRKETLDSLYDMYSSETLLLAGALADHNGAGSYNTTPIWREDALNYKPPQLQQNEVNETVNKSIDILIEGIGNDDLNMDDRGEAAYRAIANFDYWGDEFVQQACNAICTLPTDREDIAEGIEHRTRKILMLHRHEQISGEAVNKIIEDQLLQIRNHFQFTDVVQAQDHLFAQWVETEDINYFSMEINEYNTKLNKARAKALKEIYYKEGIGGIIRLVREAEKTGQQKQEIVDSVTVSKVLYIELISNNGFLLEKYLVALLSEDIDIHIIRNHVSYLFGHTKNEKPDIPNAMEAEAVIKLVGKVIAQLENADTISNWPEKKTFLLHAIRIDQKAGRDFVDGLPPDELSHYFSHIRNPRDMEGRVEENSEEYPPENTWLAQKYVEHKRPRLGWYSFFGAEYIPFDEQIELLDAMLNNNRDVGDSDPLPRGWDIQQLFDKAVKKDLTEEQEQQLINIEFKFHKIIKYGTRDNDNVSFIHRSIGKSPESFVELHKMVCRPDDGQKDEDENDVDEDVVRLNAERVRDILFEIDFNSINYPWNGEDGELQDADILMSWVNNVRNLASEAKRSTVIDQSIAKGLVNYYGQGMEPILPVCRILEKIKNSEISKGFHRGRVYARGVVSAGRDGMGYTNSELSNDYDIAAEKMRKDGFQFVAKLMEELARTYHHHVEREKVDGERRDLDWR